MPELSPASKLLEHSYSVKGTQPYELVLAQVQGAVATAMKGNIEEVSEQALRETIERYITDQGIKCALTDSVAQLANYIYHDMAGLSFITRDDLLHKEGFEEIDINAWNDVEVVNATGRHKTPYSFLSPQHAMDIHLRMFRKTQTPFNDATPRATADIGDGIRITALKAPLVDANVAVASSIRKVNTQMVSAEKLLANRSMTSRMLDFLMLCLLHGASICISGETGAGKTTLAGTLLQAATKTLRTYTIEEGSREWNFVQRDTEGQIINSVIHTKTKPNLDNEKLNIDQEALVKDSLRFDPDIIAPGEIRGREAFEVMGVSNTGHTVITTIHSNGTADTPERMVTLAKKAFDMTDSTLYGMAARAFPILVHMESGADRRRRVTEIREVTGYQGGELQSKMLFEFEVSDNIYEGDCCVAVEGDFTQPNAISGALMKRFLKKGATRAELDPYITIGGKMSGH